MKLPFSFFIFFIKKEGKFRTQIPSYVCFQNIIQLNKRQSKYVYHFNDTFLLSYLFLDISLTTYNLHLKKKIKHFYTNHRWTVVQILYTITGDNNYLKKKFFSRKNCIYALMFITRNLQLYQGHFFFWHVWAQIKISTRTNPENIQER